MSIRKRSITFGISAFLLLVVAVLTATYNYRSQNRLSTQTKAQSNQIIVTAPPASGGNNLQLKTFTVITLTPSPTPPIVNIPLGSPSATLAPSSPIPITAPQIGGPVPPAGFYCIDDENAAMCTDTNNHLVPKGTTGVTGTCGTIINAAHKLVAGLPQYPVGPRTSLTSAVSTTCSSTGPYSSGQYLSTFFVIDAFNLAGFSELSKTNPSHVNPTSLLHWWQSPPAGYTFVPSNTTNLQRFASGQRDLTGCVAFLYTQSGYHVGIINKLELYTPNGDGVISILQSGTQMYIDRIPVAGWSIGGVAGFGCRQ